jgi:hypothetical protein
VIEGLNAITLNQTGKKIQNGKIVSRGIFEQVHPLTCGNDSRHPNLMPFFFNNKIHLVCPECDYVQENASIFSVELK